MKKYIDLHCHPFKEYFNNQDEIIQNSFEKGVEKMFVVGTDLKNSVEAKELAQKHKNVFPIIGIHPNDVWNEEIIEKLEQLVDQNVVGIGEIGLDYHYDNTPSKEMQKKCFIKQIEIARKNNIPIVVHSRDAHEDTYEIIKKYRNKYPNLIFILHSYSSGESYVQKYVDLGVYFSFSGIVTFKNAKDMQEAAKIVPLDLIFCETDTPYLAPTPYRGQINRPEFVVETTNFIAMLKNISVEELLDNIHNNVKKCFLKIK
ncbi:TatD family hydrolase [Mesomycoplasma moatsii]|uniref:TatD family hydrolase n=1 Tax=Mesomycoplasma moatsii TaxID=171287 RepID=UPI0003B307C5